LGFSTVVLYIGSLWVRFPAARCEYRFPVQAGIQSSNSLDTGLQQYDVKMKILIFYQFAVGPFIARLKAALKT